MKFIVVLMLFLLLVNLVGAQTKSIDVSVKVIDSEVSVEAKSVDEERVSATGLVSLEAGERNNLIILVFFVLLFVSYFIWKKVSKSK